MEVLLVTQPVVGREEGKKVISGQVNCENNFYFNLKSVILWCLFTRYNMLVFL